MYSNAQILAAVLANFIQPMVAQMSSSYIKNIPFLNMIENKVKTMGITNPNWTIANELAPFAETISSSMVEPIITKYVSNIPDESIPGIAHSIVDKAIENGELKLLDGYITLDGDDLGKIKDLLTWNLPIKEDNKYKVKTSEEE